MYINIVFVQYVYSIILLCMPVCIYLIPGEVENEEEGVCKMQKQHYVPISI